VPAADGVGMACVGAEGAAALMADKGVADGLVDSHPAGREGPAWPERETADAEPVAAPLAAEDAPVALLAAVDAAEEEA
jgi:hypothetical protein